MIVGFSGKAGSGKDFAAKTLSRIITGNKEIKVYKFADPLKSFCRKVFDWTEDHTDGDLKETPDDNGVIPRVAMQRLGTEWGRELMDNIWVECLHRQIYRDVTGFNPVSASRPGSWRSGRVDVAIVTDVRFENEATALKNWGGILIHLDGKEVLDAQHSKHASELSIDAVRDMADLVIDNSRRDCFHLEDVLHLYFHPRGLL